MILQGIDPYRGHSSSLGNRLCVLYRESYMCSIQDKPAPVSHIHTWRVLLLRLFGAQNGRGCHIYPCIKVWTPWNLKMGSHSGVKDGAYLYCMDKIETGDYVAISQGTALCGGTHDYNSSNLQLVVKPIVIGTHAWTRADAFLHPGVFVPEGAVVGARSVVTKSLDLPWGDLNGQSCKKDQ